MQALLFKSRLLRRPPRCRSCPTWTTPASSSITCGADSLRGPRTQALFVPVLFIMRAAPPPAWPAPFKPPTTFFSSMVPSAVSFYGCSGPSFTVLRLCSLNFRRIFKRFLRCRRPCSPYANFSKGLFPFPFLFILLRSELQMTRSFSAPKFSVPLDLCRWGPCQVQARYPWLAPAFFVQVKLPRQVKVGLL